MLTRLYVLACLRARTLTHTRARARTRLRAHTHACTQARTHTHTHTSHARTRTHTHTHTSHALTHTHTPSHNSCCHFHGYPLCDSQTKQPHPNRSLLAKHNLSGQICFSAQSKFKPRPKFLISGGENEQMNSQIWLSEFSRNNLALICQLKRNS